MMDCGFCGEEEVGEHELCLLMDMAAWNQSFGIDPDRETYGEHYDTVMAWLYFDEDEEEDVA